MKGPWHLDPNGWCYEADFWENQQLCSAAPAILEALKEMVDLWDRVHSSGLIGRPIVNQARAAIRAAEGGEGERTMRDWGDFWLQTAIDAVVAIGMVLLCYYVGTDVIGLQGLQ
jgi:hypothetical protein